MKNLLVAQSGGPTAAINATLAGVVASAKLSEKVDHIYGAVNGIEGVLGETFIDLDDKLGSAEQLHLLCQTPAAALGSCRLKIRQEEQLEQIVSILRKHEISYFIYIGGNDSMDTVDKLASYCRVHAIHDLSVMGAPKTIDNDLCGTDHCPGFGSAAKYIATTISEIERDCHVYAKKAVTIVEIMGRNAGWLTAASSLSRLNGGKGPDLIYLCESPFYPERFIQDVKQKLEEEDAVLVAVSEGVKTPDGKYVSELVQSAAVDNFGHAYIAGAARVLEDMVREQIGCKVRSIELNLMQRCASHLQSATDEEESRMLGMKAATAAISGETGKMAAVIRISDDPYRVKYDLIDISQAANAEKNVPVSWITPDGHDVTEAMTAYLKPLIQGESRVTYRNGIPETIQLY
uniref:Pyrophosphate--fructose 6-phosphate 1-phosphotransferase n=1 Tax=Eubacterium cellulosolvens (strain ATCC 43171 / JCM 9499 / 6) TaxID=633697 RepID=I5ATI1_EUBC6